MADGGDIQPRGNIDIVIGKRTMKVLTFTEQEAKSIQSMGAGVAGSWSFVSLFVGAGLAYTLALVTQETTFKPQHWVVIAVLGAGAVVSFLIGLWFKHLRDGTLEDVKDTTKTQQ